MKLILLLCLSFVPWGHGYVSRGSAQKPLPAQTSPPTQAQDPAEMSCAHMEQLRDANQGQMSTPLGDKFDTFDWQLTKELHQTEGGNIVISPVSLKVVLAMLYEGANGTTAQEIGDALDLSNNATERRHSRERFSAILKSLQTSEGEYKIKMGTHAFIDQKAELEPNYQCKLKTYYNSDIVKVDFSNPAAAVKTINNWAKNVTEGRIQSLLSESDTQTNTIMLLLNAVYFKGLWEIPFPANQTQTNTFHLDDQKSVKVPFMNVVDKFEYYNIPDLKAHMLKLPYRGEKFSMYVLLPYDKTGLNNIAKTLGPARSLKAVIDNMIPTLVNLTMPKFEFVYTTKLRSTLEKLGIKTMFTSKAELDDIATTKSGELVVSNVLQKAGISVTEAGTVAYAATAVDLGNKFGGAEEMVDFNLDRPFLFFIEDTRLKTTVFVGKVTNPDNAKVVSTPQETSQQTPQPAGKPSAENPTTGEPTGEADSDLDRLGNGQPGTPSGPNERTTKAAFNFFDGDLLQAVSREVTGNFVISPASVKTLMGLIFEASDGVTLDDLKIALRLTHNSEQNRQWLKSLSVVLQKMNTSQLKVDSATNVYHSKDLTMNSTYIRAISDIYKAGIESLDFKSPEVAANKINSWVHTQTEGKIPSVVDAGKIDPETMAVLVNTVYFDAKWKEEFKLSDTNEDCFYSEPDLACNKVPIMYKAEELNYKFDRDLNSHVVQIPYQDERFSMVLVVPAAKNGLRRIARDVSKLTFPALINKTKTTEVHLRLPRFTAEFGADIKMILTKLGLGTLFSEQANIPFMINNKQARITDVVHKAKIEVSEKGTKAAAASGASVVPLMSGNDPAFITADHPFYYFIYETESGSVLFSGRVSSLKGQPGTGAKDDYETVNLTPLSGPGVENMKPRPISAPRPAGTSRPNGPGAMSSQRPNYVGSENHPYDIKGQATSPTQPSSPSESYGNPIMYPTASEYLSKYGQDHYRGRNLGSHKRTSANHQ
ncbi:uncharacterized protein LOC128993531 [Macrosteles quadrilineatus]|uniref:uncharacterized protein LOC128993531 n=1 Tax=Macrosteles quadrilineatus TaxID=74068 RepID=UPI0023E1EFFE|nr:uncharacterized protein LOC128993531 [Macrosteles quadrilineatus]